MIFVSIVLRSVELILTAVRELQTHSFTLDPEGLIGDRKLPWLAKEL
jgi:hypothetical protein